MSALAARWLVTLEHAPRVTTMIALAIQAMPAAMLCMARDAWLQRPAILLTAMLVLALPSGCDEVWLNTANSQFHIAVAVALALVLQEPATKAGKFAMAALVLIGPLCSPVTCALFPLLAARAVLSRQRYFLLLASCLLLGAAVQLICFYYTMPGRGGPMGASILLCIVFAKNVVLPLLGSTSGDVIVSQTQTLLLHSIHPMWNMLVCLLAIIMLAGAAILRRHTRPESFWLMLAAASIALASYFGALGQHVYLVDTTGSNRYAFAPNVLIALGVLSLIKPTTDRLNIGAAAALAWLVAIGFQDYVDPHMPLLLNGPSWVDGVRHWRSNPTTPIPIWPTGWNVKL
jgi:hypothetical protein